MAQIANGDVLDKDYPAAPALWASGFACTAIWIFLESPHINAVIKFGLQGCLTCRWSSQQEVAVLLLDMDAHVHLVGLLETQLQML